MMKRSFKNSFCWTLFLLLTANISGQVNICLGEDTTVCEGETVLVDLCSTIGQGLNISGIYLDAPTIIPTLTDDSWSDAANIGFDFTFYDSTYNQFVIGSNGIISFDMGNAGGYCPWALTAVGPLPSTATAATHNAIMPAYQDMNPSALTSPLGNIQYQTIGTAPNRMCVIIYKEIGQYQCGIQECNYLSVILFETSNDIEIHIGHKSICGTWNGSLAIQGIQNSNGTIAHMTPGRNNSVWVADQDGYKWEYLGGNDYNITAIPYLQIIGSGVSMSWQSTLGEDIDFVPGQPLEVTADAAVGVVGWFLGATSCETAIGGLSIDTTYITTASPEVIVSSTDDICGQGVGSVTATPGPGSPPPYSYSWPALGAATSTVSNVLPGTYTVSQMDGNGCGATALVTVGDNPSSFTSTSTPVSCAGGTDGTATAIMTPSDGSETFIWSNGQTTATATNLAAGVYTCEISASSGCVGNVSVTVGEIPIMNLNIADQNDATCNSANNGSIQVGVSEGTPPYTFSWDQNSSTTNEATNLYAGTYVITVTDDNGCSDQITATIGEPDALSISNLTPDSTICSDAFINLEATGNGGSSPYVYTWTANGSSVDVGQSITVNPVASNTQYCVTLSEECGSPETTECLSVTFPTNISPIIAPNIDAQCVPGDFTIYNNTIQGAEVQTTQFAFSNGETILANGTESIQATFEFAGTYDCFVTITSTYGCIYTEEFQNIVTVTPPPTANFTLSKNPATWFETEIQTTEACVGDVIDFQWISPGAISLVSNEGSALITFPEGVSGTYPITLVATTNEGCSDTTTLEVEIVPDVIFYAPNSFTPDDDEHNQTWTIFVEGIDFQNFTLEIFNKWGETIWETNDIKAEWDGTYNNTVVPDGTYIWRAMYKERENDGRKIHTGYVNVIR
tara:strand:- start:2619 stop:5342 length:2724 start_codon:yes stop_codon:yes gene_type:complete